ncbi:hypothetical protein [Ilumatobacter sp.]|uniref:hypothetical protein n=1 Tax=Ilumatobacter sp. TaxID=1967498 RepID=UPI003C58348E
MSDDEREAGSEASLLASLYLDGEATTDERALVETDTDALAQVGQLSDVRTILGATAPTASLSDREGHLAAALDVWERMSDRERSGEATPSDGISAAAAAALTTPSTGSRGSRSDRRRPRLDSRQWLLGTAAGLTVLVGFGFAVRNLMTQDDSATTEIALEDVADDPLTEVGDLEAAEAAEVNGENVGTEVAPNVSDLSDDASGSGLFPEDADTSADATADTIPGAEQPAPPPEEATFAIDNPDDLAIYASLAVPTLNDGPSANDDIDFEPVFGSCEEQLGVENQLEPVIYAGTPVVVGIDLDNSVVLAYTAGDCNVVESAPLTDDTGRGADVSTDSTP